MKWWRFNQEERKEGERLSYEFMRWTNVMPGDVVQSRGTLAWRLEDLKERYNEKTRHYRLQSAPVLVLSRIPGIPGEDVDKSEYVTFLCLTRHGLLAVIGDMGWGKDFTDDADQA